MPVDYVLKPFFQTIVFMKQLYTAIRRTKGERGRQQLMKILPQIEESVVEVSENRHQDERKNPFLSIRSDVVIIEAQGNYVIV